VKFDIAEDIPCLWNGKLSQKSVKPNAGVGLRFRVDKKERTNLRFDYAIGRVDQSGFYISFGESF